MKLIIDIPEQWRDDMVWENFDKVDELCQAILDGDVIPDNATNGDVIKAMFSNMPRTVCWSIETMMNRITDTDWWNTPYQRGGK